jgi:hypothetical protein
MRDSTAACATEVRMSFHENWQADRELSDSDAGLQPIFYFLIIKSRHLGAARGTYVLGLMWSPGVAGTLTRKINGQSLSTLGSKRANLAIS